MTGITANFVLGKLSPLVMTEFSDRKSLLSFLIIDIQPPHFSLLFNMVYHVVDLLNCSHLIVQILMDMVANVLSTPHHSCSASARPVLTLRTRCAKHHYVD